MVVNLTEYGPSRGFQIVTPSGRRIEVWIVKSLTGDKETLLFSGDKIHAIKTEDLFEVDDD